MNAYPFSVFKRSNRPFFSVSFKDASGRYLPAVSTKKTTETEAIQVAFQWLRDGIPRKKAALSVSKLALKEFARQIETIEDAELVLNVLKTRNLVKSFVLPDTRKAVDFIHFLSDFWDWDTSAYVREKMRKNHSLHQYHCKRMKSSVEHYWKPVFSGRMLGEVTRQDIDAFAESLEEQDLAAATKNSIIKAGTIALRWAYAKEMIERDITKGIFLYSGKSKERQILSPEMAAAVFKVQWKDERSRLGNLLACVTGLRQGEIAALQSQDIGKDFIYVRHSWNDLDKLKPTKNNESRTVEVPFPGLIYELLRLASMNPWGQKLDGFVFWSEIHDNAPMNLTRFLDDFRDALQKLGLNKDASMVYTFHSWRHYYTAYMRDRVNEKLLQSQTGHKTIAMLDHYSEHRIAGDRERIRQAQVEVFGGLLGEAVEYHVER
jgi:integrase